jgi:hypothetical protein
VQDNNIFSLLPGVEGEKQKWQKSDRTDKKYM